MNELLPNPSDGDEWIEIYNSEKRIVRLDGWALRDASGRQYRFPTKATIGAQSYLVIMADVSNIALNNSGGETLELVTPNGEVADKASYPDRAPAETSYSRDTAGGWLWTSSLTSAAENIVVIDEVEDWIGNTVGESTDPPQQVLADALPRTGILGRWWGAAGVLVMVLGIIWWLQYKLYEHH